MTYDIPIKLVQVASVEVKLGIVFTDYWPRRFACAIRSLAIVITIV